MPRKPSAPVPSKPTAACKPTAARKPTAQSKTSDDDGPRSSSPAGDAWPGGFCSTAEGEALYQRGFPHLRWLTDDAVDDPAGVAEKAMTGVEPTLHYAWPRAVAERAVRGFVAIDEKFGSASPKDRELLAELGREGPVGDPNTMFDLVLRRAGSSKDFAVEDFVFLAEAFAGSDAVAEAIVATLESDLSTLQRRGDALAIGRCLGFVLRRARECDTLVARISALRERASKHEPPPTKFWAGVLAILVDGNAAFDHFGHATKYYTFVHDRARLVDKILGAPGEFLPDMRFAYLGGPPVLDTYAKRLDELPKGPLAVRFFEELRYVARPLAEPLMRKLAARPDVGQAAKAWLAGPSQAPDQGRVCETPLRAVVSDRDPWERMSEALAAALREARGSVPHERAAIARSLAAHARAMAAAGAPPFEHAMHFFAVDGCAHDVRVTPALARVQADAATKQRWVSTLQELPLSLAALDELGVSNPS